MKAVESDVPYVSVSHFYQIKAKCYLYCPLNLPTIPLICTHLTGTRFNKHHRIALNVIEQADIFELKITVLLSAKFARCSLDS